MNVANPRPAATFSMLVAQIIAQHCRDKGITMADFHKKTGISQPSWSRLTRGQTSFDIEHLKTIEQKLGINMDKALASAKRLEIKAKKEGIKIIRPYTTQKKDDLAKLGVNIVAVAVLSFLAVQILKK
ncbi:MAG: helix-turn-helix transcriptional regulator [Pseudomonadota bacterium]